MSKNKSIYNMGDAMLLLEEKMVENRLYNYFSTLALNRFKWKNLPYGLESRHFEKALFKNGQAFFYKEKTSNLYLVLPCNPTNNYNILGDPLGVTVTGFNSSEVKGIDEGIRILDNDSEIAPLMHVAYYVELLTEVEKTIQMNLKQQRIPLLIATTEKNKLSMSNLVNKIDNFEEMIIVDELMNQKIGGDRGVIPFSTNIPFLLDRLTDFKKNIQSELFSFLGLNNNDNDKKERLLEDEVNANNSFVLMSLDLAYKNRLKACELINEKFGLNIEVEKTINELEVDFTGGIKDYE